MQLRIEDYALISDTQTAALVGIDGSIDWLCAPRFDSAAFFAALLGKPGNGRWRVAARGMERATRRRYVSGTLVLETEWQTETGLIRVTDFMPPRTTQPDVVRLVHGVKGRVEVEMELVVRFDYGRMVPWARRVGGDLMFVSGPDAVMLRTDLPTHGHDARTEAQFTIEEGQFASFVLSWGPSYEPPREPPHAAGALETTVEWWRSWADRLAYKGAWKEDVRSSLIVLKALTHAPTGGMVAAPTTSLPEQLGSVRNWDYRYCWLRDAAFTMWALSIGGYSEEARAWRNWLLRAAAGDPEQLQVLYGVTGESHLVEQTLDWLPGYEHSAPVRIGNAAVDQFQLDVFGEVMHAFHLARGIGMRTEHTAWALEKHLVDFVVKHWQEPDEGIWEVRGPKRHFTHSKVLAWVAVDRAVHAVEKYGLDGPVDEWRRVRRQIHDDACAKGFDEKRNAFVQSYGATDLDASLLMIPLVGFLPPSDPRVRGTIDAIRKNLMRDGLVLRYKTDETDDGLPPGEGVFLACTFWLVDNLSMIGEIDEATRIFERLLSLRNDVGLLSEEWDPVQRRQLGNFPQAMTHVGLVNSAFNLDRARRSRQKALRSAY